MCTSIVWKLNDADFQNLLNTSNSKCDVLRQLGLDASTGNHRTLNKRLVDGKFNLDALVKNRNEYFKSLHKKNGVLLTKHTVENAFVENSDCSRKRAKMLILRHNLIEYKCFDIECPTHELGTLWKNKKLVLQLDHINGVNNDNRLENLCFLCPNCHSQTVTFAGKRLKKDRHYETREEKEKRCIESRKFNPSVEELSNLVKDNTLVFVGKHYKVSDAAVKKRCKLLGIDCRKYGTVV